MAMEKWFEDVELREPKEFERREPLSMDAGVHEVYCEDDGRLVDIPDFEDKSVMVKKLVVNVKHLAEPKAWFVTVGETTESMFGQLVAVSRKLGGIAGHTLKIAVAGKGKSKRYQATEVDGKPVEW